MAYKSSEPAYVEQVRLLGDNGVNITYKYRYTRNPIIGDKFSSRHGQKGVLSVLWPQENMPFNEQGLTPDVIINPHAFPSRMTIGMLVESLAGKSAALEAKFVDATTFTRYNKDYVEEFGSQLIKHGYQYYGNDFFYSGIVGVPLQCDIYFGLVQYQRLRHMVSDKAQVRATGPIDQVTKQPLKGRKRGGGIRVGEMERDSLLAYGVSFIVLDRLLYCSDYAQGKICKICGSILTIIKDSCTCGSKQIETVNIPFVLRYLCVEMAALGIRMKFNIE